MFILEPEEMRAVDRYAIDEMGIPGRTLMKNAAASIYEELKGSRACRVAVFAGKGNNGGDSLILAGMLADRGFDTKVYLMAPEAEMGDNIEMISGLREKGVRAVEYDETADTDADIIVDGILGTGFRGLLSERYKEAIKRINSSDSYIVAVDIPSGLDAKSGEAADGCVKADLTVAMGAAKTGFFQGRGPEHTGRLEVKDIGIPAEAYEVIAAKGNYLDGRMIAGIFPERKVDSNKGDFGKTIIAAGSKKMPGAGILCCRAALRAGPGYVFCRPHRSNRAIYCANMPEVIQPGRFEPERYDSAAIGPGLGIGAGTAKLVRKALDCGNLNLILDADALNSIDDTAILQKAAARVAITPHPKEMAALLGRSVDSILKERLKVCSDFSKEHNTITLLKGRYTVISDEKGKIYVNSTGNNALSKAGTGDVLTGLIAGFSAYMDLFEAVLLAAYLHGLCADMYVSRKSPFSLTASELLDYLPESMAEAGLSIARGSL